MNSTRGERDATRLHHGGPVSRHHDGAGPNRATEWSGPQQRNCGWVCTFRRANLFLAVWVIAVCIVAICYVIAFVRRLGAVNGRGIGGHWDSRLRPGELSSTSAVTWRNTGYVDTGGEHDSGRAESFHLCLRASGPLNRWGLGQPERNRRRVARWMLRSRH